MNDLKKKPLFRIRIILQLLSCLCILFCAKDPEPVLMIDLRDDLKLKGTLSGTVTDINGKPLSAVSVTLEGTDNSTLSLPDGTFKIPNVASGLYTLVFRHYSYKDTTLKSIAISTNQNLIISDTIEMKSSKAKLTGRTVSNKQKAVPGAGLTVTYQPYQTLSGDSGFFSFPELISGQINIVAAYRGIGWGEKKLSLQPGDSADISITLDNEGGSIRGRVIGADNNPVKNKIVSTMNGAISDTTNDKGEFSLENLPSSIPLTITGGPGYTISGLRVTENGQLSGVELKYSDDVHSSGIILGNPTVISTLKNPVYLFADVRSDSSKTDVSDLIYSFVWDTNYDNSIDTLTTSPELVLQPDLSWGNEKRISFGVILKSGDTVSGGTIKIMCVSSAPQVSAIVSNKELRTGEPAAFTGNTVTLDKSILKYIWDFGDGSTWFRTDTSNVIHRYSKPGVYKATFQAITDSDTSSDSVTVTVSGIHFSLALDSLILGENISLDKAFNTDSLSYWATVPYEIGSVSLRVVSSDSTSIIICNNDTLNSLHIDSIPLNVGKNTITIRLVSPLGLEGKYSINITRQANPDASLSDLTVFANGNKINFAFNPDSLNYSFSITDTVTDFTLHPQVIDISSIILIGTDTLKSDSVYKPVLQDGDNLLTIKIIAPDKIHSRTYTLSVFRRTTLAATITLNGTEISQLFTIEALIYNAVLPPSVTNAELTITPESPNARISVQRSAPSSVTDYNIPVAENDTIEIRIISGDGTDTSTYYIYITRTLYTVKISKTGAAGGSISPSEDMSVDPGNDLTISFINTPDYTISELIINGVSNRNPGSSYTFTNISQSNSLVAVFTDVPRYSLQMSWTDGGTVGPQTIYNIHANDTIDIYAKPSEGYIFAGWSVSDSAHIIETNTQQTKAYLTKGNGIVTAKFIPGIIYVSTTGSDNNNGFSWATAKRTLQAALDVAQTLNPTRSNPVQIWLAQGTYNPTKRSNISEPRSVIFTIPDHVHLYGGFTTEESSPDERQFYFDQKKSIKRLTFYTTLSGDLNNNNENDASDAIRVLSGDTVILDGLTIFSGFNDQLTEPGGVALLGNAVIKNCEFIQNRSVSSGGALTFIPTTQEASINNSLFSMNISEGSGGAIFSDAQCKLSINNSYFYDNSTERNNGGAVSLSCSVELNNCLFDNNTAPSGGALHLHVTALTTAEINRTTFRANTTVDNKDGGGAVFIYGDETNSQCKFTNCVFDQNKITHEGSDIGGGALSVQNINLKLMNCTFYANSIASSFGGALFIRKDPDFGKSTSIVNCIFWENTAPSTGQTPFSQEIHISDYSVPTVSNTCIRGLDNAIYTGQGNFADDPIFEDLSTQPPDLRLKGHSPCIDNGSDIGAPLVDITNKPRDNRPDVGAYEY